MGWLLEAFEPEFMQRALLAGLIAGAATAVVGTWVVARGLSFLGDALAHGVMPGLAIATLGGFSPVLGALVAALLMSGAVTLVGRRAAVRDDTGIGLLFVGMLALGVIIISKSDRFTSDVTALLFGEILGVTWADLRLQAAAAALVIGASMVLYRPFLALAFNRDKAATFGLHPTATHVALLGLLSVSIVASFQAVGTLMIFGLLIAPAATAGLLARRVPVVMIVAVAVAAVSVIAGLELSYHAGTAAGASIAGLAVGMFFAVLLAKEVATTIRSPHRRRPNTV